VAWFQLIALQMRLGVGRKLNKVSFSLITFLSMAGGSSYFGFETSLLDKKRKNKNFPH
jgi:hypothetical protein